MDIPANTPGADSGELIRQRVAGAMLLHNRAWAETTDGSLNTRCECGFTGFLEDIADFEAATISHRASMVTEAVKGLVAVAWDQGWQAQDDNPKIAGIFLNPYRDAKWDFDTNRISGSA